MTNCSFVIFYKKLIYKTEKERSITQKGFPSYILLPNISDAHQMALNQGITSREMTEAIRESPHHCAVW